MPRLPNRPAGMRARRDRSGTATYYLMRRDGTKLALGKNFQLACSLWVQEQRALVKLAHPATALELLRGFEQCSLPLTKVRAAALRSNEIEVLTAYFSKQNDPALKAIQGEEDFLTWYRDDSRSSAPDTAIRLFRMMWQFALQLELVNISCPWSTLDLRKAQLKAEAADVVRQFSSSPLKEFLEELLTAKTAIAFGPSAHVEPGYAECLRVELAHAVTRATLMLRKSGRTDLLAPVFQLEIDDLIALRHSPVLALCRPPGKIFVNHQRVEVLASLKAANKASDRAAKLIAPRDHSSSGSTRD